MPYPGKKNVKGWGVVRENPWHLVGIFETEQEALLKRAQMGADYVAAYGEGHEGSDDFMWSEKLA